MAHVSPADVEKHLKGIDYPASKEDLLKTAKRNGADKEVCDVIQRLPDQQFERPTDVAKAMSSHNQDK
ncbi:MAG: DUF2795 domain-containing protein [Ktedonobacteraceae bacterium]